ncbi:hypothetical protein [Salinicola salarius]|nr:hypothetical protein [Salinicola salarius]
MNQQANAGQAGMKISASEQYIFGKKQHPCRSLLGNEHQCRY